MTYLLCESTILWRKIGRGFLKNQMGPGPLGFLANPQLLTDLCNFINYHLSWASHAIPLSMMSYQGFYIGLKSQFIPLSLAIGDVGLLRHLK